MISDRSGALSLGVHGLLGKLLNGRVVGFQPTDGLRETNPRIFFLDGRVRFISELELSSARNNLLIEFVALNFQGENKLRYQYKLEGVDADWSVPTEARSINYAHLAAGSYPFLARAINQEGIVSAEPASLRFRILPPIWQRWWFLTISALVVGSAIYLMQPSARSATDRAGTSAHENRD